MNYIKHLTGFFHKSNPDNQITPTHISLYLALFQRWNLNRFKNQIFINREEIMILSKIKSKATYHKCIKDLHNKKYIVYKPSFNPYEGTEVSFIDLSDKVFENVSASSFVEQTKPNNEPKNSRTRLKNERTEPNFSQVDEQVYNIYNNKTYKNNINIEPSPKSKKNTGSNNEPTAIKEKSCAKKEEKKIESPIPTLEIAVEFFLQHSGSETEAQKYFNYYSSNGWLVGGKTKMKDWKAAARNWMLNANKFQSKTNEPQPNHLNTPNFKNYAEPL